MPKETGLMFKAPLVRGILDDLKTQTRRIAKLPHMNPLGEWEPTTVGGPGGGRTRDGKEVPLQVALGHTRTGDVICAPNQPGDRIYVRETWQGPLMSTKEWEEHYFSNADELPSKFKSPAYCKYAADGGAPPEFMTMDDDIVARWKPSIHMPKWAARIWLEVTGVRVERLQDICEADVKTEGVAVAEPRSFAMYGLSTDERASMRRRAAVQHFRELWESTGGDWAANPWVWVIDFKRITDSKL